jgi:hypothetical protein
VGREEQQLITQMEGCKGKVQNNGEKKEGFESG